MSTAAPEPSTKKKTDDDAFDAAEFVKTFCEGELADELTRAMKHVAGLIKTDAARRERDAKSKGEVNISIKFSGKLEGQRDVALDVNYEIKTKEPKPVRSGELFFVDRKNNLVKSPIQQDLDLPLLGVRPQ